MDWITTTTMLSGLRDEQDAAWDRFVSHFQGPLTGYARRMGLHADDAEDVAQETLLAVAQSCRAGRYRRERGRLSRWLFGIAARQVQRARRRQLRGSLAGGRAAGRRIPTDLPAGGQGGAAAGSSQSLEACLDRVRGEVQESTYRAFELVVLRGCSAPEAAALMGVPVKSIYNAKHRVLRRMRDLMAAARPPRGGREQ